MPLIRRLASPPSPARRTGHGQSLVEFALVLPILLLLVLVAIDFGRVYLGYVNLQQMARIAGAFAADHASAWQTSDPAVLGEYQYLIANDASTINCELPKVAGKVQVPAPAFPAGFDLGDPIQVRIPCNFSVLTPIISQIVGGVVPLSGTTTYPIREAAVAEIPGGGGPVVLAPVADFVGSPQSGFGETATSAFGPLDVTFTDLSTNAPTNWEWNFGDGSGSEFTKGPHTIHYECNKAPGETCSFTVSLTVGSTGAFDTKTKTDYITVTVPPATGPIAEFTATPRTGVAPLAVSFAFVDKRAGAVTYTNYEWDFDGDGTTYDTVGIDAAPSHTYSAPGAYTVTLRVTDDTGATAIQTKTAYIVVDRKVCTAPDFANHKKNTAQDLWAAAGFTTNVSFAAGNGNYTIHSQTITGGTIDPQPGGCASTITVGP